MPKLLLLGFLEQIQWNPLSWKCFSSPGVGLTSVFLVSLFCILIYFCILKRLPGLSKTRKKTDAILCAIFICFILFLIGGTGGLSGWGNGMGPGGSNTDPSNVDPSNVTDKNVDDTDEMENREFLEKIDKPINRISPDELQKMVDTGQITHSYPGVVVLLYTRLNDQPGFPVYEAELAIADQAPLRIQGERVYEFNANLYNELDKLHQENINTFRIFYMLNSKKAGSSQRTYCTERVEELFPEIQMEYK